MEAGRAMYYHARYWWRQQRLDRDALPVHHTTTAPPTAPPPLAAPEGWQVGVDALLLLVLLGLIGAAGLRVAARARPDGTAFRNLVAPAPTHARARFGGTA